MSFEDMKSTKFDDVLKQAKAAADGGKKSYGNENEWKLIQSKDGNGSAKIRPLPACDGESNPIVWFYKHFFWLPSGKAFVEYCPTTLGHDCPVCEANKLIWDTDEKTARARGRKLHYMSNILVLSDPANPENEGKVFLFRYGKQVFKKIMNAMEPPFDNKKAFNPFDFWKGANLNLRVQKVSGFPNYDESEFDSPAPLSKDEKKLKKIYGMLHSMSEFTDPENYKSYGELQHIMDMGLGRQTAKPATTAEAISLEDTEPEPEPKQEMSDAIPWDDDDEDNSGGNTPSPQKTPQEGGDDSEVDDILARFENI